MDRNTAYEKWLNEVTRQVRLQAGKPVHLQDLPDQPYKQWFDNDMDPSEAAKLARAGLEWT